jgi:hypothetical protein
MARHSRKALYRGKFMEVLFFASQGLVASLFVVGTDKSS